MINIYIHTYKHTYIHKHKKTNITEINNQKLQNWLTIASFNEWMLSSEPPWRLYMLFNVRAAWLTNKWKIVFSDDVKRSMKLAVRMSTWYFRGRKLNIFWYSVTISTEPVRNNFMKMRVNEKSNECLSRSKRGHALTQNNNEGKHLGRIKLRTTSSDACLPILLNIELNEVKKELCALSKEHLYGWLSDLL